MSLAEILTAVDSLDQGEKLHLMHKLVDDLAVRSGSSAEEALLARYFPPGVEFEVHTPFDCHEAADVLHDLLEQEKGKP